MVVMEVMLGTALAISLVVNSLMYIRMRMLAAEISRMRAKTEFSEEETYKLLESLEELKKLKAMFR